MGSIKKHLSIFFLVSAIITLSFFVLKIQGFAVSIALLFIVYHILTNPVKKNNLIIIALFVLFFTFNLVYQIWFIDFIEYFKTFFLILLAIYSFLNLPRFKYTFSDERVLALVIKISASLIVSFEILQVYDFLYNGSTNYFFLFDSFSISTAKSADRFQAVNLLSYIRPISFFHEPSYLGSVLLMLLIGSINLSLKKIWSLLIFIGIVGSLSVTVYIFTILYLIYFFRKYLRLIIPIFLLLVFLYLYKTDVGFQFFRLGELSLEGSSGHERVIAPFQAIIYEFFKVKTIFGRALGQTEKQLDNSFYVLLSYFGVFLPALFFLIKKHVQFILKDVQSINIFLIFFFNMLFVNGAIITPESQFMLFFVFLTFNTRS